MVHRPPTTLLHLVLSHFRFLSSDSMHFCLVYSHSPVFEMLIGHFIFSVCHRQLLMKTCNLLISLYVVFLVVFSRMVLMHEFLYSMRCCLVIFVKAIRPSFCIHRQDIFFQRGLFYLETGLAFVYALSTSSFLCTDDKTSLVLFSDLNILSPIC